MRYSIIGSAALGLNLAACAAEAPNGDVATGESGLFGETEAETLFQLYAGQRTVAVRNLNSNGFCSGTQVRAHLVLTAKHCLTTDRSINGPLGAATNFLFSDPGVESRNVVNVTSAQCLANTNCTRGVSVLAVPNKDWALVNTSTAEPRSFDTSSFYVPLNYTITASVGSGLFIAGYGRYSPSLPHPQDGNLNFGDLKMVEQRAGAGTPGTTAPMMVADGVNGTLTQQGDSGTGIWSAASSPPGLVGVVSSGNRDCTFGEEFCDKVRGAWVNAQLNETDPNAQQSKTPFSFVKSQDATTARDWTFSAAAEENDFTELLLEPDGANGWQIANGTYTQTLNSSDSVALAKTAMSDGCAVTSVQTADDDVSGIVFRWVDANNFYVFDASATTHKTRLWARIQGEQVFFAEKTWNGTWATEHRMMVCFSSAGGHVSGNVTGYVDDLNSSALSFNSSHIQGGRLGLYNDLNQGARHNYLETISLGVGASRLHN